METMLKKNNFWGLSKEQTRLAVKGFIACFVILVVFQFYINETKFYYDGTWFYKLSKSFFGNDNSFSFLNFPGTFRGYFFPLMLSPIHWFQNLTNNIINELYIYRALLSIMYGATFGVFLPATFENIFSKKVNIQKRIIFLLLVMYFWSGLLTIPLADMPLIVTLSLSIFFFSLYVNEKNLWKILIYCFLVGIFLYASYNIRTINIALIGFFPIIFFIYAKYHSFKLNLLGAFAIFLGILVSSLPQIVINNHHYQKLTPLVLAEDFRVNLFVNQLYRGINTERFQTYLGGENDPIGLIFYSEVGSEIFNSVKGEISLKTYLILVSQYPLDFIGIYYKHIMAALDIRWGADYARDINNIHNFFAFLNYTCWFFIFFFSKQVFQFKETDSSNKYMFFLFFLPPSIASIPAPSESRYYVSLFILIYIFLVFNTNWKDVSIIFKTNILKYSFYYSIFLIFMYSMSGITFAHYAEYPMFLSGPSDFSIYVELILDKILK